MNERSRDESDRRVDERWQAWLARLAGTAELPPGDDLDRRVRGMILARPPRPAWALRPGLATGIALAALLALVSATLGAYLGGDGSGLGMPAAILALTAYLGVSCAATLPLLLLGRNRTAPIRAEVRP